MCALYTFELLIPFAVSDIFEEEYNMLIITINSIVEDILISNIYIFVCVYILAILKLLRAFLFIILFYTSYVICRSKHCFSNTTVQLRAKPETTYASPTNLHSSIRTNIMSLCVNTYSSLTKILNLTHH